MFKQFRKKETRGKGTKFRQQMVDLWNKDSSCYWCRRETVIYDEIDASREHLYKDRATLDHLYTNHDIRSLLPENKRKVVLSCYNCNQHNAISETRAIFNRDYKKRNNKISIISLLKKAEYNCRRTSE